MAFLEDVRALLRGEPGVRLAYLFGSTARGEARPSSDVDLGVILDTGAGRDELAERLERGLARTVDLVDLRRASPLLLHEILRDGRVVVCRDELERSDFESRALREYLDTQHLRDIQGQYLRERAEERLGRPR